MQAAFMNTIAEDVPRPDMLMFLDEAACNSKNLEGHGLGFSWKKMCAKKVFCRRRVVLDPPGSHHGPCRSGRIIFKSFE
jgi:hypothetical protein